MNETAINEFWIGFRDASYFVRHFLKKGFQHVYVLQKIGGRWVEINPRNHALEVFLLDFEDTIDLPQMVQKEIKNPFIRIKIEQRAKKYPNLNIFNTIHCTNIVKYILGIGLWAITPYQIYKRLSKMPSYVMNKKGILEIEIIEGD